MDPFDRMTNEELKAMRGTSWAAVVFAVIGMVAAATFAGLYFLNYSEIKMTRDSVDKSQKAHVEQVREKNETIARLNEEVSSRRDENEMLKQQLKDEKIRIQQEKNRADTLADKVNNLEKTVEELRSGDQGIVRMQAKLAESEVKEKALQEEIQRTRNILANTQTKLSESKQNCEKLEKELKEAKTDLENAKEQIASLNVTGAARDVLESQLKDKEKQIDDLKEKLRATQEDLARKDRELGTLQQTLGKSGQAAEELQKALEELSNRDREIGRKDAQIDVLSKKVEKLETENDEYEKNLNALRTTLAQRGDVSEQVKALSETLADREQNIKKKDEEIAGLREQLEAAEETVEQTSETGKAETTSLHGQLDEKNNIIENLEKQVQALEEENDDLDALLKSERVSAEKVEKGEEFEKIRILSNIWRTGNEMEILVSDGSIAANKIDLESDLGLEMNKNSFMAELYASGRFGFLLEYQELTFEGRNVMQANRNFYDATLSTGDTVDTEIYIQQPGVGLLANLGALHKSETRRIDIGLLLGGRYYRANSRILDRTTGTRGAESLNAPLPYAGIRLLGTYRAGVSWSIQAQTMNYNYDEYSLRNYVEARATFGFNIKKSLDINFGYAYSNTNFKQFDEDTGETFLSKHTSEGPFFSIALTF